MIQAGDLRCRIQLYELEEVRNVLGERTMEYRPGRRIWAQIVPTSGRSVPQAGEVEPMEVTHRAVSYTHLDVYKRQLQRSPTAFCGSSMAFPLAPAQRMAWSRPAAWGWIWPTSGGEDVRDFRKLIPREPPEGFL